MKKNSAKSQTPTPSKPPSVKKPVVLPRPPAPRHFDEIEIYQDPATLKLEYRHQTFGNARRATVNRNAWVSWTCDPEDFAIHFKGVKTPVNQQSHFARQDEKITVKIKGGSGQTYDYSVAVFADGGNPPPLLPLTDDPQVVIN